MENKMNKSALYIGIILLILSPFVLSYMGLFAGIVYIILGVLSVILCNKGKEKTLIIFNIIGISLFLLALIGGVVLALVGHISYFIQEKEFTSMFIAFVEQLENLISPFNYYIPNYGTPSFIAPVVDEGSLPMLFLGSAQVLINTSIALLLPLILLLGSILFKKNRCKTIFNVIMAVLCVGSIFVLTKVSFTSVYYYIYASDYVNFSTILNMLVSNFGLAIIMDTLQILAIIDAVNDVVAQGILAIIIPLITLVVALVNLKPCCKMNKCHKHQVEESTIKKEEA